MTKLKGTAVASIGAAVVLLAWSAPVAAVAEGVTTVVTVESVPVGATEYLPGWNINPGDAVVTVDGLTLAEDAPSRVLFGVQDNPAVPVTTTPAGLLADILSVRVEVVSGSVTAQFPIFFGNPADPSFTTIRSLSVVGPSTGAFQATDQFVTTAPIGDLAMGQYPLEEIIAALPTAEGVPTVAVLGFGVQADTTAVVRSFIWNETQYVFQAPTVPTDPPVTDPAVPAQPAAPAKPTLPDTGADPLALVIAAAALLAAGGIGFVLRRRSANSPED